MQKTVPFEVFGMNQYLKFDIIRLAELEMALGQSLPMILKSGNAGVNFCLRALPIALKQHYHKASPEMFAPMIEKYLDEGGSLDDLAMPIVLAIARSGILGKAAENELEGKDPEQVEETDEKNG